MMLLLNKVYSSEGLADIERDVLESLEKIDAPTDEWGFFNGSVKVEIVFDEQRETLEEYE